MFFSHLLVTPTISVEEFLEFLASATLTMMDSLFWLCSVSFLLCWE
jgi:hypothetical protein